MNTTQHTLRCDTCRTTFLTGGNLTVEALTVAARAAGWIVEKLGNSGECKRCVEKFITDEPERLEVAARAAREAL